MARHPSISSGRLNMCRLSSRISDPKQCAPDDDYSRHTTDQSGTAWIRPRGTSIRAPPAASAQLVFQRVRARVENHRNRYPEPRLGYQSSGSESAENYQVLEAELGSLPSS